MTKEKFILLIEKDEDGTYIGTVPRLKGCYTCGIKESIFNSIESVSVDYGIMEKADSVKVIPGDFGWADLGSWKSIDDILGGDDENNRAAQSEKAIFVDSHNCSVFSEDARISVVGLSNLVVVQAGNEILVIDKDASQNVRRVVDMIREK